MTEKAFRGYMKRSMSENPKDDYALTTGIRRYAQRVFQQRPLPNLETMEQRDRELANVSRTLEQYDTQNKTIKKILVGTAVGLGLAAILFSCSGCKHLETPKNVDGYNTYQGRTQQDNLQYTFPIKK